MTHRVVVTGMAGLCPLGTSWDEVKTKLLAKKSGVTLQHDWDSIAGLRTRLGATVPDFQRPPHYPRKKIRTMGRVALLATRATELALMQAGLLENPVLHEHSTGIAYGSASGSPPALQYFMEQLGVHKTLEGITGSHFTQFMSHTCAANIGQFFEIKGRILPIGSACTASSQSIGYAYEMIKYGRQQMMITGGAEELHVASAVVFDVVYATSKQNDHPDKTPRPFDVDRDGLVAAEGAATLILESLEHAQQRRAPILAEVVGFATNCDGEHMVNPSPEGMQQVMEMALQDAHLDPDMIDYVNAHATATEVGDIAESQATVACFKRPIPISALKSYMGHTFGACGALEAWLCIQMMAEGWLAPTINLDRVDPRCAELDYLTDIRPRQVDYVMSNNFAFGGINTSLIFKRWGR
ncbi:MAG: beta-ketoacyl-ACP synthase [Deltaproteobacteria bacterium]|nr:beta-ketoacyl-ACP synthase [Deltaproteobacteria bacterium]